MLEKKKKKISSKKKKKKKKKKKGDKSLVKLGILGFLFERFTEE
jgi:hypothetical protein